MHFAGGLSGRAIDDVQDQGAVAAALAAGGPPGPQMGSAASAGSMEQQGVMQPGGLQGSTLPPEAAAAAAGPTGATETAGEGEQGPPQTSKSKQVLLGLSTRAGHALGSCMRRMGLGLGPDAPNMHKNAGAVAAAVLVLLVGVLMVRGAIHSSSSRSMAQRQTAADIADMNGTLLNLTSQIQHATSRWDSSSSSLQHLHEAQAKAMQDLQAKVSQVMGDLAAQESVTRDMLQHMQRQLTTQQAAYKQLAATITHAQQHPNTTINASLPSIDSADAAAAVQAAVQAAVSALAHPAAVLTGIAGGLPIIPAHVINHSPAPATLRTTAHAALYRLFRPHAPAIVLPSTKTLTQPSSLIQLMEPNSASATSPIGPACPLILQLQPVQPAVNGTGNPAASTHPHHVSLDLVLHQPINQIQAVTLVSGSPSAHRQQQDATRPAMFDPALFDVSAHVAPLPLPSDAAAIAAALARSKHGVKLHREMDASEGAAPDSCRSLSGDNQQEMGESCTRLQSSQLARQWLASGPSTIQATTYTVRCRPCLPQGCVRSDSWSL